MGKLSVLTPAKNAKRASEFPVRPPTPPKPRIEKETPPVKKKPVVPEVKAKQRVAFCNDPQTTSRLALYNSSFRFTTTNVNSPFLAKQKVQ